jgi:hypothetical protein
MSSGQVCNLQYIRNYSNYNRVKPALNRPFINRKFALNRNILRSRDFGAEKDVKYPGLNG